MTQRLSIGPGLGRDLRVIEEWPFILENLNKKHTICDADFFWFFTQNIFDNLAIMKKGKGWVFTPNKREFIKIFSSLNKQAFGFSIIEKFLDHLDIVVSKIKKGNTVNEVVNYGFGDDKNGDGVLSIEGLSNKEKHFQNITQNLKSLGQGELSNQTIKIFHLGKIVKVIF